MSNFNYSNCGSAIITGNSALLSFSTTKTHKPIPKLLSLEKLKNARSWLPSARQKTSNYLPFLRKIQCQACVRLHWLFKPAAFYMISISTFYKIIAKWQRLKTKNSLRLAWTTQHKKSWQLSWLWIYWKECLTIDNDVWLEQQKELWTKETIVWNWLINLWQHGVGD